MKKYFVLMVVILLLFGCSVDPISGKSSLNFFSEADEIKIGDEQHPKIVQEYGEYDNQQLHYYVQNIVSKIGDVSHRPNLNYQVTLLDTPMINAFALPGGHVYVCRGLLPYLNSESELATIMAHEIGHVTARHSVEQMSQSQALDWGVLLGSFLFFKEKQQRQQFYNLGANLSVLASLSYSREDEMEADRLGIEYADKAGFSPLGLEKTMKMFERMQSGDSNPLFTILSTHPASEIRSKQARIEVRKLLEKHEINREVNRERYLNAINGLALGDNPQRGIVYGRTYYNTTYRFKIILSHNFKAQLDNPNYLLAINDEDAGTNVYYKILAQDDPGEKVRVQELEAQINAKPVRIATYFWNKYEGTAYLYTLLDKAGNPQYQLTNYFMRYQQYTMQILILEKKNNGSTDLDVLNDLMVNTQPLTDQDQQRLITIAKNLQIYEVKPGDTWASITEKYFKGEGPQRLAWLNGCELNEPLPSRIKLALF